MTATQYVPNSKVYHCNIAIGNCKPCEPRYQNSPQCMLCSTHFSTRFQDSVKKYWHEMTLQPAKTYSAICSNTAARKRIECCFNTVIKLFSAHKPQATHPLRHANAHNELRCVKHQQAGRRPVQSQLRVASVSFLHPES